MGYTLADMAKLIQDSRSREFTNAGLAALSDGFPLLRLLSFLPASGQKHNIVYSGGTAEAATRAMNSEFTSAETAVDDYDYAMRAVGGQIKVDINFVGADADGGARQFALGNKVKDIGRKYSRLFFTGDASNSDEFDGVNALCADATFAQTVSAGTDGATVTKEKMREVLRLVPDANLILCNGVLAQQINDLDQGVSKTVTLNSGLPTPQMFTKSFDGVPIMATGSYPDDSGTIQSVLPFDETQGSSDVCSRVTVLRLGPTDFHGRQHRIFEMTPGDLNGRREGSFMYWDMNWFNTPCVLGTKNCVAQLIGVKAS